MEARDVEMMHVSPRFEDDGGTWKDVYIQQSTLGHLRETHRHHERKERKWRG